MHISLMAIGLETAVGSPPLEVPPPFVMMVPSPGWGDGHGVMPPPPQGGGGGGMSPQNGSTKNAAVHVKPIEK
jgi:hypothetical protein